MRTMWRSRSIPRAERFSLENWPGNSYHFSCKSNARTISGWIDVYAHVVTAPVGVNLPAVHHLQVRTAQVQLPSYLLARVFDFKIETHMGIAPVHPCDCTR